MDEIRFKTAQWAASRSCGRKRATAVFGKLYPGAPPPEVVSSIPAAPVSLINATAVFRFGSDGSTKVETYSTDGRVITPRVHRSQRLKSFVEVNRQLLSGLHGKGKFLIISFVGAHPVILVATYPVGDTALKVRTKELCRARRQVSKLSSENKKLKEQLSRIESNLRKATDFDPNGGPGAPRPNATVVGLSVIASKRLSDRNQALTIMGRMTPFWLNPKAWAPSSEPAENLSPVDAFLDSLGS